MAEQRVGQRRRTHPGPRLGQARRAGQDLPVGLQQGHERDRHVQQPADQPGEGVHAGVGLGRQAGAGQRGQSARVEELEPGGAGRVGRAHADSVRRWPGAGRGPRRKVRGCVATRCATLLLTPVSRRAEPSRGACRRSAPAGSPIAVRITMARGRSDRASLFYRFAPPVAGAFPNRRGAPRARSRSAPGRISHRKSMDVDTAPITPPCRSGCGRGGPGLL